MTRDLFISKKLQLDNSMKNDTKQHDELCDFILVKLFGYCRIRQTDATWTNTNPSDENKFINCTIYLRFDLFSTIKSLYISSIDLSDTFFCAIQSPSQFRIISII